MGPNKFSYLELALFVYHSHILLFPLVSHY